MKQSMHRSLLALTTATLLGGAAIAQAEGKLNIYN